ncbi:MAG: TrpR-related protein YerC/YecD [Clostridia bacterium]|nr:TrpR-related protein YerC/YecD [Clostridia bacterium]MBQ9506544.1 TrpR-related protein YerC/YecD [Clostridia bacterium]MBR5424313.1 TrpR-related protein YerC/YecD [Clostridia bacterium]
MADFYSESIDRLLRVIVNLESVEEAYRFFSDVCTIKEMQDMAQRLDAAFLLAAGENYQSISKTVGISTATISRVSRCLNYGRGGYQDAIRKMTEKNDAE